MGNLLSSLLLSRHDESEGRIKQVLVQLGKIYDLNADVALSRSFLLESTSGLSPRKCTSMAHYAAQFIAETRHSEIQVQNGTPNIDLHINRVCWLSIFCFFESVRTQNNYNK